MDRAFLQETYQGPLGLTVYSLSLKNFKTSFWNLPIQTKTSIFASYPIISYKFINKSFIKLSFCFLRVSSRSHNPGPAAAWNAPGLAQVTVLSTAWGCPKARKKMLGHPLSSPQPGAPATLFCGDRIKSLLFSSSSCALTHIFGKARGDKNTLPFPFLLHLRSQL